jgi:hypothetical protein
MDSPCPGRQCSRADKYLFGYRRLGRFQSQFGLRQQAPHSTIVVEAGINLSADTAPVLPGAPRIPSMLMVKQAVKRAGFF